MVDFELGTASARRQFAFGPKYQGFEDAQNMEVPQVQDDVTKRLEESVNKQSPIFRSANR